MVNSSDSSPCAIRYGDKSVPAWGKLLGSCLVSSMLVACASGPVGGPLVEDLSLGRGAESTTAKQPVTIAPVRQAQPLASAPAELVTDGAAKVAPINVPAEAVSEPLSQPPINNQVHSQTPVATPANSLPEADKQVVENLLNAADQAKARSATDVAIMKLQQAQRIAPREPKVYARLAALYLADGQAARAEQLARKGLTLVAHSAEYSHYFWRVIAACRRFQGDAEGEAAALVKARQFNG